MRHVSGLFDGTSFICALIGKMTPVHKIIYFQPHYLQWLLI